MENTVIYMRPPSDWDLHGNKRIKSNGNKRPERHNWQGISCLATICNQSFAGVSSRAPAYSRPQLTTASASSVASVRSSRIGIAVYSLPIVRNPSENKSPFACDRVLACCQRLKLCVRHSTVFVANCCVFFLLLSMPSPLSMPDSVYSGPSAAQV